MPDSSPLFRFIRKPAVVGCFVFILLLSLTQYLSYQRYLLMKETAEQELTNKANQVKEGLQTVIQHGFSVTQTLAFIVENYGTPADFDSVAKLLLKANQNIDAVQLTKGGVITNVYPLEGNEAVIGFNVLLDSARKSGALATIEKKGFFVSGPINLKQGDQGFVCRIPIFKNNEFWGFSAAIIKISTLLKAAMIDTSESSSFSYQLAKINTVTGEEEVFLSTDKFSKKEYAFPVEIPNGEWRLYIAHEKSITSYTVIFLLLGLALSILGGVFAWFIAAQPARLDKLVDEKILLLQTSERRYQTLTEVSPVGIFHTDINGNTTYVNPAWCRISGMPYDKALGNGWFEAVHHEDRAILSQSWQKATKSHQPSLSEYRFVRPDGSIVWVMGQAIPQRNADNEVISYVGTTTDITERKKAEEEIEKEKFFSESIINSLPGILYLYDENGKFIKWNKNFETFSEYTGEELVDMHPLDFFDNEEKLLLTDKIKEVFESGMGEVEANLFTKSKKKIPYYFNGRRITLENRICLIGMGIDISELKNARDKIAESEKRFRHTLDQMLEGVQIFDFEWRWRYINDAAVSQGRLSKEFFLNKTLLENYPGIENTKLFRIFEECKKEKISRHIEYEFTFPDMSKKWFELSIQPNPDGLFILSVDISDRKKAEQEVQQITGQLRRLTVHQQTALEEERKRISREIHDELGQQLTAIKMDIAWIDKKTEDQSSFIKSKLKNVITLLDASNQSIRKILTELRMGVLDDHDLGEALDSQGRQFTSITGIPLLFSANKRMINVSGVVAACIFRAFQEALTNITKYAEAKKVIGSLVQDNDAVTLKIEDDGKGFDPDKINNSHSFGILGMKERVASLNGTLQIKSQPGEGTSITIRIPYKL